MPVNFDFVDDPDRWPRRCRTPVSGDWCRVDALC
jgi:hypothetical protein